MKRLILFLAGLAVGFAKFVPGFRVRFDIGLHPGKDFFVEMPRTVGNATAMGWSQMKRPQTPLPSLVMYCPEDPIFCVMYDPDTKYIAAFQIALALHEFTGAVFDWTRQGFIPWTRTLTNGTQLNYMTKQVYLVSEDTLSKSKTERLQAAAEDKVLQEDSVWAMSFNQKLMPISTNVTGIVKGGFTKQSCIPWMGTHYFYNMRKTLECLAETLANWFLLEDSNYLIGMGFLIIGVVPKKTGQPYYFERPSKTNLKVIVKDCPDCFAELAEEPTGTTMHVYFIDEPWKVGCWSF